MKIGVVYPQNELKGDPAAIGEYGLAAESLGFDHLIVYDHVLAATHADRTPPLTGPYTEHDPFHDPFMVFAYLAGITTRLEFATGVLVLPQRQTALVARQAADLDLISNQRLRLGVGVGWNYVEYDALGCDFHTRGARLDEQIGVLRELWSNPLAAFEGNFHHLDRCGLNPRPKRVIPIWVGGFSEAAYRRAGTLGDGHIFAEGYEKARAGWERIEHYLDKAGRSSDGFGRDLITRGQAADRTRDAILRWRDWGGSHVTIGTMGQDFTSVQQHIDYIAEVKRLLDQ